MKYISKSYIALCLMFFAFVAAIFLHPNKKLADIQEKINLEQMVPNSFARWNQVEHFSNAVVNPEQRVLIDKLYTQTLSRVYQRDNQLIMLSIAYGDNQSDATALHYPEVCYPAQGYRIASMYLTDLKSPFGQLKAKRLLAAASNREEFITYWTTLGNKIVRGKSRAKIEQINYGLKGYMPDGMLFRVSSVGTNPEDEFAQQQDFINDLLKSMPASTRVRFIGS